MNISQLQDMQKKAQDNKYVSSIPMCMAKPMENTKVRFWTKFGMEFKGAITVRGNSLVGVYKNGCFVVETDKWSDNEVFSWAKFTD